MRKRNIKIRTVAATVRWLNLAVCLSESRMCLHTTEENLHLEEAGLAQSSRHRGEARRPSPGDGVAPHALMSAKEVLSAA